MNSMFSAIKLNRNFRIAMDRYYQNYPVPGCLSNDEMDDIDNTFCGCFFE